MHRSSRGRGARGKKPYRNAIGGTFPHVSVYFRSRSRRESVGRIISYSTCLLNVLDSVIFICFPLSTRPSLRSRDNRRDTCTILVGLVVVKSNAFQYGYRRTLVSYAQFHQLRRVKSWIVVDNVIVVIGKRCTECVSPQCFFSRAWEKGSRDINKRQSNYPNKCICLCKVRSK